MKETKTTNPAVEQNNDTKPADNQNVDNQTADTGNDTPDSVPYARFNEITRQNKKLQEQIKKDEEARESARIKQMEEEGKTKELYAELQIESKSLKEKVAHYEEIEKQERDSLLEQLSEEDRELYGNLSTPSLNFITYPVIYFQMHQIMNHWVKYYPFYVLFCTAPRENFHVLLILHCKYIFSLIRNSYI